MEDKKTEIDTSHIAESRMHFFVCMLVRKLPGTRWC